MPRTPSMQTVEVTKPAKAAILRVAKRRGQKLYSAASEAMIAAEQYMKESAAWVPVAYPEKRK